MPEPTPSVRRLLVLGTSSSEGVGIARRDEAYPQLLGRMLSATCGEVEVIHRRYYAHMPGAGDFFAAQLAAFPADWVVLQTTAFGLTLRTVPIRIEQLFGARAGRLAKNMVGGWEDPSQAPPGGHKFRDAARWLAHHTIGTATATRYEPLIEGYKAAIEQMARLETTWTATIGTGQPHSVLVKLNPSAPDTVRRFNAELFEAARAHRIPWIDHDAVPHDSSHDAGFVDFIHRNAAWHERIAAELFAAISVPAGVSR